MIKANELRIGNWLHYNYPYANILVKIEWQDISAIAKGDNNYSAIKILPEILEGSGFEHSTSIREYWWLEDITIEREGNGFAIFASEWTIGQPFNFVHELQNIVFFLFKKELEINLHATA